MDVASVLARLMVLVSTRMVVMVVQECPEALVSTSVVVMEVLVASSFLPRGSRLGKSHEGSSLTSDG